jgi:hypothetical protein
VQAAPGACQEFRRAGATEQVSLDEQISSAHWKRCMVRDACPTLRWRLQTMQYTTRSFVGACEPGTPAAHHAKRRLDERMRSNSVILGQSAISQSSFAPCRTLPLRCGMPHASHARCSAAHRFGQHTVSGSTLFRAKTLISPASQVGRHRAMAGLSTMTHATMNAPHATYILIPPPVPGLDGKVVMEKWGKYDKFVSCTRRCSGIGVRAARLPLRESCRLENRARSRAKRRSMKIGLSIRCR